MIFSGTFAHSQFSWFSTPKTVPVSIIEPPKFGLMVKRVAFGNPEGGCAAIGNDLIDSKILPLFQRGGMDVVERQALNQMMSEYNFSQSGYEDANSIAQIGKILGPSALIIVSINVCSPEQLPLYQDIQGLNNSVTRNYISKTRYSLRGSLRVVDLTTGQVIGSHDFQSQPEEKNTSTDGQPEFPPVDEVQSMAMQQVQNQIAAMFFPYQAGTQVTFYDDKDCDLNQVYLMLKNGDKNGASRMMDSNLEACKTGKHKDKTLARAYYDDGLLHCLSQDYDKAITLFTSAMDHKGAEAVSQASEACQNAQSASAALDSYMAKVAKIQTPPPINNQPTSAPASAAVTAPPSSEATVNPPPSAGKPASATKTPEARLKELDSLFKRGLITRKEYDEKRAEILKDL